MKKLISNLCSQLESGNDLILASIIKSSGSTPRSSGSKMIVKRDGSIDGTIGGGLVEALVQKEAAQIFDEPANTVVFREFDLSNELAANADMICGGHVEVMLEHLPADERTSAAFNAVNEALRTGKHAVLFTVSEEGFIRERQAVRPCCQLPALQFCRRKRSNRTSRNCT